MEKVKIEITAQEKNLLQKILNYHYNNMLSRIRIAKANEQKYTLVVSNYYKDEAKATKLLIETLSKNEN